MALLPIILHFSAIEIVCEKSWTLYKMNNLFLSRSTIDNRTERNNVICRSILTTFPPKVHLGLNILIYFIFLRWKFVAPMLTHRRCTTSVSSGNFVFIIGGHDGAQILNTIETYDVERFVLCY